MKRRYRLSVEEPDSEDIDGIGDAVIECATCEAQILLWDFGDFTAADLDAAKCGCSEGDR